MSGREARYDVDMSTLAARPLRRLSRPEAPPPFRMTDRHIAIMRALVRYRHLSSDQISRIVGGSSRGVGNNLRNLFWHGYIERPRSQNTYLVAFFDEGNRPLVYGIARKGVHFLAEFGDPVDARMDWRGKNNRSAVFLAHTLETATTMIGFATACSRPGAPRLIDHIDLLPLFPEKTRDLKDPFALRVTFAHDRKDLTLTIVPDRLCSFAYSDNTRHNFAIEQDLGSESVGTKSTKLIGKSSIRKKQIAYFQAWKQSRHTEVWGFQSFRCLFIVPSEIRIHSMIKSQREVTNDTTHGLFLYTTPQRLAEHGAFGPAWISSTREGISLLPPALRAAAEVSDAR